MKFGKEFLLILFEVSDCMYRHKFVMDIFAALCGETDIRTANDKSAIASELEGHNAIGSSKLPQTLRNVDSKNRTRLYERNALPKSIREHIQMHAKEVLPFTEYLDTIIDSKEKFSDLCRRFKISGVVDKNVVYTAIFRQFLEFSRQRKTATPDLIQSFIEKIQAEEKEINNDDIVIQTINEKSELRKQEDLDFDIDNIRSVRSVIFELSNSLKQHSKNLLPTLYFPRCIIDNMYELYVSISKLDFRSERAISAVEKFKSQYSRFKQYVMEHTYEPEIDSHFRRIKLFKSERNMEVKDYSGFYTAEVQREIEQRQDVFAKSVDELLGLESQLKNELLSSHTKEINS